MSKGLIVIVDLGHDNSQMIKEEVESLGVDAVICEHDVEREYLESLGEISGFILNGGPNKMVNGFRVEASEAIYEMEEIPTFAVDHASPAGVDLFTWPKDKAVRINRINNFLTSKCDIKH